MFLLIKTFIKLLSNIYLHQTRKYDGSCEQLKLLYFLKGIGSIRRNKKEILKHQLGPLIK